MQSGTYTEDSWGVFKVEAIFGVNNSTGFTGPTPNLNDALWWDADLNSTFGGASVNNPSQHSLTGIFYGLVDTYAQDTSAGGGTSGNSFRIDSRGGWIDLWERTGISGPAVFGQNASARTDINSFPNVTDTGELVMTFQFRQGGISGAPDSGASLDVRFNPGGGTGSAELSLDMVTNPFSNATGTHNSSFDTNTIQMIQGLPNADWTAGKGNGLGGGGYNNDDLEALALVIPTTTNFANVVGGPVGTGWTVAFADDGTNVIPFTAPVNGSILQVASPIPEPGTALFGFAIAGVVAVSRRRRDRADCQECPCGERKRAGIPMV
jgi:hypothetical protein